MGMQPTEPNADILSLIEDAEAEIIRQNKLGVTPLIGMGFIRRVKKGLTHSDKRSDDLLFDGLAIGYLLGLTAQGSETDQNKIIKETFGKFNKKNRTRQNLAPGEKGPGRYKSEITRAMEILADKIPPPTPYIYNRSAFMKDLVTHHESLQKIIRPVKPGDTHLIPLKTGEPKVLIARALFALRKATRVNG